MTEQELFLGKMYQYLGEIIPTDYKAYPFELFTSSPMAKAAARAFNDLTTIS